jgi:hypothetical protein
MILSLVGSTHTNRAGCLPFSNRAQRSVGIVWGVGGRWGSNRGRRKVATESKRGGDQRWEIGGRVGGIRLVSRADVCRLLGGVSASAIKSRNETLTLVGLRGMLAPVSFTDNLRSTSAFVGGGAELIDGVIDEMEACFVCVCVAGGRCNTDAPAMTKFSIKLIWFRQ